jgi:hypothetical protein
LPRAGLRERDALVRAVLFAVPRLAEVFQNESDHG